ncbi:uncharacterized protein FIBRA_09381 [Fibroporia radiculosa]|uniref:SH3 domain-containing protein n=1 Tax=Fibroporia radiculosa TaxID=599839 RepID=J7S6E1_9APHY|nr:uncharacterized protein FIBRA_09381 [Fibroporia radiculosa]CCM07059.1 predicted protein [Fibroporia radiculosa]
MPVPTDPQAAALLTHVLSQIEQNVAFLSSQNYISSGDAADIMARLTALQKTSDTQSLAVGPPRAAPSPARQVPLPPARSQKAKALWAYNEDGQEPNDLSFSAGEMVEVVDETNADWWTGKCRGRQGLFPSNHVEKISSASIPLNVPLPMPSMPATPIPQQPVYAPMPSEKSAYRPFGAVHQVANQPPAVGANSVGLQQAPQQEQKRNRFGGLGNTMAQSAAGGVGFGAGAAIGSGIVNAIF